MCIAGVADPSGPGIVSAFTMHAIGVPVACDKLISHMAQMEGNSMKAVVWRGIGDIRLEDVEEPRIQDPNDAIIRITASAICGTDLHMVRGTMPGMVARARSWATRRWAWSKRWAGTSATSRSATAWSSCSTIGCGYCSYCRAGYFSQCDNANPNGKRAGTAFFGGPKMTGPFHGLQAERARIPFANVGLVKLPDEVTDNQAIMLSDIFPTGYFGADLAEIKPGNTVAVFGCGPVGQFAILSAMLKDAGRVFAIDRVPDRLEMARAQGAEVIDFEEDDPVEALLELTGGVGVDRAIDAVGVDADPSGQGAGRRQGQADGGGVPAGA